MVLIANSDAKSCQWKITQEMTCIRMLVTLNYELIYQLNAIEYLLCTISSTCFGLTRSSSGAMDVKFLYIYSIWCPWCS